MQIFAEFEDHEALVREFESNLGKARAFVLGRYEVAEREEVELVLIHPASGEWLPLRAEVVYIAPAEQPAVGLEILEWSAERSELVRSFVEGPTVPPLSLVSPASLARERVELGQATPHVTAVTLSHPPIEAAQMSTCPGEEELRDDGELAEGVERGASGDTEQALFDDASQEYSVSDEYSEDGEEESIDDAEEVTSDELGGKSPDSEAIASSDVPRSSPPSSETPLSRRSVPPPKNVQERVRRLNLREREAMARGGTLTERVALERAYGAAVWDGLLSNAALTGPEVARIAKNGNATIPHLAVIVGNPAWLAKGEVRRALLTNPRLTPPQIERVLRALSPNELKNLPKQTAYAPKVRAVAMRMLSR